MGNSGSSTGTKMESGSDQNIGDFSTRFSTEPNHGCFVRAEGEFFGETQLIQPMADFVFFIKFDKVTSFTIHVCYIYLHLPYKSNIAYMDPVGMVAMYFSRTYIQFFELLFHGPAMLSKPSCLKF